MRHHTLARLAVPTAALAVLAGMAPAAGATPVSAVDALSSGGDPEIAAYPMGVSDDLVAAARRTSPRQAVLDYWTPARMRAATPVETPAYTTADLREAASQVETSPLRQVTRPVAATEVSPTAAPFSTVAGKVFFSNTEGNFICSAAAINSRSKSVVSTAGHCLHEGGPGGELASNWVFVPGYARGRTPKGVFAARTAFLMQDWVDNGATAAGFNRDYAFARLGRNGRKQTVVGAVGGNGLTVGGGYALKARLFGYPGNIADGEVQKTCAKTTSKLSFDGFSFRRARGCGFGGGSSGGPWVTGYDARKDVGQLRGITSFGPADNSFLGTPYFDASVSRLLRSADQG